MITTMLAGHLAKRATDERLQGWSGTDPACAPARPRRAGRARRGRRSLAPLRALRTRRA